MRDWTPADRWRPIVRDVARRVARKVRDRAIEASDLEQVGLLALYAIEHESERVVRHRLRIAMWNEVPHRRALVQMLPGGEEIAAARAADTLNPEHVVDAHRVVRASRGRVLAAVLLAAQGEGPTEIGRIQGISKEAASQALRRAWRAAEHGRVVGLGRTGRPKKLAMSGS